MSTPTTTPQTASIQSTLLTGIPFLDNRHTREVATFIQRWKNGGNEKQETTHFWNGLFKALFNSADPLNVMDFEKKVKWTGEDGKTAWGTIDVYVRPTRVLIEQKGSNVDLDASINQSDGSLKTPFQQAERYNNALIFEEKARYVITSNFLRIRLYDMNRTGGEKDKLVVDFPLEELPQYEGTLECLIDPTLRKAIAETTLSLEAGKRVGELYKQLRKQFGNNLSEKDDQDLNKLCVRLVFCLYAEDAGLFEKHLAFNRYLEDSRTYNPEKTNQEIGLTAVRNALEKLFKALGTPPDQRNRFDTDVNKFPYVNGGLFADTNYVIPPLTNQILHLLIDQISAGFNWSGISPTIFGAVFESTLNPETRRAGGMHYTSIQNIHRVIDPLFLDALKAEFEQLRNIQDGVEKREKLLAFQKKLGKLKFLDPACGSGNFLTETYLSLRRLENEILRIVGLPSNGQSPIQVTLDQFGGIEINGFATSVAQTALWIAESQMMKETLDIVYDPTMHFLPLHSKAHIVKGNALRMDWNKVIPSSELSYIYGNPPFLGYTQQSDEQKADLALVKIETGSKKIDYVAGWYFKAATFLKENSCHAQCAFVSTNSLVQGEHITNVWKPLFTVGGIHINFAYQTFKWDSEAGKTAAVHVVIIGFSLLDQKPKRLYSDNKVQTLTNINAYFVDGPNVFLENRKKPICEEISSIHKGSIAYDGKSGNLTLSQEEKDAMIEADPSLAQFIRPFMQGKEFIDRKPRYCLWLTEATSKDLKKPLIYERISKVKTARQNSPRPETKKLAQTPALFGERRDCKSDHYIALPEVTSGARTYIPMGFQDKNIVTGGSLYMIENASMYEFGVLTSIAHMAWMRVTTGRMKSDYSYSVSIVYNNFIWPEPTESQRKRIEETAQAILDARNSEKNKDCSLAELYDSTTMPEDLLKAHQANDRAVLAAYHLKANASEEEIVAHLFQLYADKIEQLKKSAAANTAKTTKATRTAKTKKKKAIKDKQSNP